MKKFNVLVLLNKEKDKEYKIINEVVSFLITKNCLAFVEGECLSNVKGASEFKSDVNVDFALILGGDGTILNFAHKYSLFNFPFFGINLGRVGCLIEANFDNYQEKIESILNGDYLVEDRNTIECEIIRDGSVKTKGLAFNEVSLQRAKFYKMMNVSMLVNNSNLTSFYSDGVVVATSTGSSAFSLSCGGPLLLPTAKNFVITPISPQLRTITSLVVNDSDVITLDLSKESKRMIDDNAVVVIDGCKLIEISCLDKVVIKKANKKLRIIKVNKQASLFEPTYKVALSSSEVD